jgi:hypothetical protein
MLPGTAGIPSVWIVRGSAAVVVIRLTSVGIEKFAMIGNVYRRGFALSNTLIFKAGVIIPFGGKNASLKFRLVLFVQTWLVNNSPL